MIENILIIINHQSSQSNTYPVFNGINVFKDIEFPDHYHYTNVDIKEILLEAKKLNCKIITTEKDYLRLENFNLKEINYLRSELKIIDEEKFIKSIF